MNAQEIASAAADLVSGDRAQTHGDKTLNHQIIADLWNGFLKMKRGHPLDAHDAANMMELLKIARRYTGSFNIDDYIDGCGYASVAGEIKVEQERRDKTWADAAIEGCPAGDMGASA
jgi:hypothetical protein